MHAVLAPLSQDDLLNHKPILFLSPMWNEELPFCEGFP
jgi:hypothetical protein